MSNAWSCTTSVLPDTSSKLRRRQGVAPPRLEWPVGEPKISSNFDAGSDHVDNIDASMQSDEQRFHFPSSFSKSCCSTMSSSMSPSPASAIEVNSSAYVSHLDTLQSRSDRTLSAIASRKKRPKRPGASPASSVTDARKLLWVDKYTPDNSADLCVAPLRVKEVRSWMTESISNPGCPKLLILVGSPGIGKSTVIRVLASEMKWHLHEWNDFYQSENYSAAGELDSSGLMLHQYQSQLESFEEFLHSAGMGYCSLTTEVTSNANNATLKQKSSRVEKRLRKNHESKRASSEGRRIMEFSNDHGGNMAVVMIDTLPNLHTQESAQNFRSIMTRHILRCKVPTVFVFSDVSEGKHKPVDLERLVDTQTLYSPLVKIMQCHSVTKAKMKRVLAEIAKQEQLTDLPESFFDEIHLSSDGDLRHAIMTLQFRFAPSCHSRLARSQTQSFGKRDTQLSSFHALGKLLYAKRQKNTEHENFYQHLPGRGKNQLLTDLRPALEFEPEQIMDGSDMGHSGALSFLGFHSPEFFTDISDLSQALDRFSDAAYLLDRSVTQHQSECIFPSAYVASLAGRAIADANKHPAQNKFRPFCTPMVFEVMRKKRDNDERLFQLCKRLSFNENQLHLGVNFRLCRLFVTETLPFMKNIYPHETDFTLASMHSFARKDSDQSSPQRDCTSEPRWADISEQLHVLQDDDISDYDDVPERVHSKLQTAINKTKDKTVVRFSSDQLYVTNQPKRGLELKCIDVIIIDD